jgi:hypothetical protein
MINGELNDGWLLKYEEAFSKKKATFEKTKIISFTCLFVFLSNFACLFISLLMNQGLCCRILMLEKMMLLMWVFPLYSFLVFLGIFVDVNHDGFVILSFKILM